MRASYASTDGSVILVDLAEGELLGTAVGPGAIFVPADPDNPDYDDLIGRSVTIEPYGPPAAPMPNLSDRQFGEGLWRDGLISFDHYLGFVGPGIVPPALMELLNELPDDDTGRPTPRKVALGLVTGAKNYEFTNPLVDTIRQKQRWTHAQLKAHWLAWAVL